MTENALASLWSSEFSVSQASFVCSAVFICSRWLLTARHALNNESGQPRCPLWVRPNVGGTAAFPVVDAYRHPALDVAIIKIEAPPDRTAALGCNSSDDEPPGLSLHGFFEGQVQRPSAIQSLSFDPLARHYRMSEKQPVGYSGAPICAGGKIWAIATRHYSDANTHIGCAVAVHQFSDWLQDQAKALGFSLHLDRSDQGMPSTAVSVESWSSVVDRVRSELADQFKAPIFESFDDVTERRPDGLPRKLVQCLAHARPETAGENAVDVIIDLCKACREKVAIHPAKLTSKQLARIQQAFRDAMGVAVKLCFDPARLAELGLPDADLRRAFFHRVPVQDAAAATMVLRTQPGKHWERHERDGIATIRDSGLIDFSVEVGEGADRQRAIAKSVHVSVVRKDALPDQLASPEHLRRLRGLLLNEAKEGRARIVHIASRQSGSDDTSVIAQWIVDTLGVNVFSLIASASTEKSLLLYPAEDLFPRLSTFLEHLQHSDWITA